MRTPFADASFREFAMASCWRRLLGRRRLRLRGDLGCGGTNHAQGPEGDDAAVGGKLPWRNLVLHALAGRLSG
jgi:hypothetical protein